MCMVVFTVDKHMKPVMPCSEKRARQFLDRGHAVVHKVSPFTIRLKNKIRTEDDLRPLRLKIDPGAKVTGLAILDGDRAIWFGEVYHKTGIKSRLDDRRSMRRGRRARNTRYRRPPKHEWFRKGNHMPSPKQRRKGWLPPSLVARVNQTMNSVKFICKYVPISCISVEHVKFDTQLMQNPDIADMEYQQGTLYGYELREYLLEKWNRKCAYCKKSDVPMEIEHIIPKSRGGSNRESNLCIACHKCNQKKGNMTASEFGHPEVQINALKSLKEAALMNATRWKLWNDLKRTGLNVEAGTGARTKHNRIRAGLPKEHYFDAACVGASTPLNPRICTDYIDIWKASGRGSRQIMQPNKYGFPRQYRTRAKIQNEFMTGDYILVTDGKYEGKKGRLTACMSSPYITIEGNRYGVSYKKLRLIHRNDGWERSRRHICDYHEYK